MTILPLGFADRFSAALTLFKERSTVLLTGIAIFSALNIALGIMVKTTTSGLSSTVALIVVLILSFVSSLYYLVAVTQRTLPVGEVFSMVAAKFLPFVGLSALVFLKTFTWIALIGLLLMAGPYLHTFGIGPDLPEAYIPLVIVLVIAGFVCGFVFFPRYILASVLWNAEGKSVTDSVRRSYDLTRGQYMFMLTNLIMIGILSSLFTGIVGAVGGALGSDGKAIIVGVASQFSSAFITAYLLQLAGGLAKGAVATPPANPAVVQTV